MKIILTENVPNLGFVGDEVAVKDGYARNFLLPKGMALPLNGNNARIIRHHKTQLEKQRALAIDAAKSEAEKVTALSLVLRARSGTGGKLFGSVTNRDIQAAMAEQGVEVDRKSIVLHAPVKSLGTYIATVRIHTDVKVDLEFKVEASEIVAPEVPAEGEEGDAAAEGAEGSSEAAAETTTEGAESTTESTESTSEGADASAGTTEVATEGGESPESATDAAPENSGEPA